MYYVKQDDFDSFKCMAGQCPRSCCIGWQIVIDDESLDIYENSKCDFKNRLQTGINFDEGIFLQSNKRCSMLNDIGLCDLQINCGEDMLCYTCKTYPRHVEEFEDVREFSLSLSCPKVAQMVIDRKTPISFVDYEDDEEDDFEEFDYMLYTKLVDARKKIFSIIQNRSHSLQWRMEKTLELAEKMQKCVDENRIYDMDLVIEEELEVDSHLNISDDFQILSKLEVLSDDWTSLLNTSSCTDFMPTKQEEIALEQILVLLIFTYFCGAVYDDEIYAKAALCVHSIRWIYMIYKSHVNNEDLKLLQEVVYRYAREVEHSDLNLDILEDFFIRRFNG